MLRGFQLLAIQHAGYMKTEGTESDDEISLVESSLHHWLVKRVTEEMLQRLGYSDKIRLPNTDCEDELDFALMNQLLMLSPVVLDELCEYIEKDHLGIHRPRAATERLNALIEEGPQNDSELHDAFMEQQGLPILNQTWHDALGI